MRLLKLEINNLFAYRKCKIDFTKFKGSVLIKGRNNSGKSAIIRTIIYTIFDQLIEGRVGDDIVRRGKDFGWARLTIKIKSKKYVIERGIKKGKAFCEFYDVSKKKKLTERKKEDTNKKIVKKIGMDFNIARNSIMFGQGDVKRFVHVKDAGRKEVFCSLISKLREVEEEYDKVSKLATDKNDRLNELLLDVGFPNQTEAGIKETERQIKKLGPKIESKEKKVRKIELKLGGKKSDKEYKKLRKKFHKIRHKIEDEELNLKEISRCRQRIEDTKLDIGGKLSEISKIRKGKCLECNQSLPLKKMEKIIAGIDGEIVVYEHKLRELKKEWKGRDKIKERVKKLKTDRAKIKTKMGKCNITKIQAAKDNLIRYKEVTEELADFKTSLASQKRYLKEDQKRLKKQLGIQKRVDRLQKEVRDLSIIENALSSKGIRQDIIDDLIPVFEEKVKFYLRQLADGVTVRFVTTVKAKSVDKDLDKFSILVYNGKDEVNYQLIGGGIRKVIEIAISFALSDFALEQSGTKNDFILLDEMFSALDEVARNNLVSLLTSMQKKFKNIIIISHLPEIQDLIKNQIEVVQKNGISKIV